MMLLLIGVETSCVCCHLCIGYLCCRNSVSVCFSKAVWDHVSLFSIVRRLAAVRCVMFNCSLDTTHLAGSTCCSRFPENSISVAHIWNDNLVVSVVFQDGSGLETIRKSASEAIRESCWKACVAFFFNLFFPVGCNPGLPKWAYPAELDTLRQVCRARQNQKY